MTVAINLGSYTDIGDYQSLVSKVKLWLDRGSDLDSYIPTFITLAESYLNRELRTPDMEAATFPVAVNGSFQLPSDFLELRALTASGVPLNAMSPGGLAEFYASPSGFRTGCPAAFSVTGRTVQIAPIGAVTLMLTYWQRIPALTFSAPTNWLLTAHPDIYLFGALAQAEGYIENPERAAQWASLFDAAVQGLIRAGQKARWGGPLQARVVRRVTRQPWDYSRGTSAALIATPSLPPVTPTPTPGPTPTPTPPPTPTPSPTPPPTSAFRALGPIGINLDLGEPGSNGNGFPWLDRARGSRPWQTDYGNDPATGVEWAPPTVNSNGYPVALNPHRPSCFSLINAEGRYVKTPGIQKYVVETNRPDAGLSLSNDYTVTSDTTTNGVRRMLVDYDPTKSLDTSGNNLFYASTVFINSLPTPFRCKADGDAVDDYISVFRADEEQQLKAGQTFTTQFVTRIANFGGPRPMDWCSVNNHLTMDGYSTPQSWSWADTVPLEALVALANATDTPFGYNFRAAVTDAEVIRDVSYAHANVAPHLTLNFELANECWNFLFQQTNYFYNLRNPGSGSENINYGYRAAQIMAVARKAAGYSDRVRTVMGSKTTDPGVTERIIQGVNERIAGWNNPNSPDYNPEFAALFKNTGQIFSTIELAQYLCGGMDQLGISAADQATVENWANDPDGGTSKVIRQLTYGDLIATPLGDYINNLTNVFAAQKAIADREQIRLALYEAMIALQQTKSQAIYNVFNHAMHDPAFQPTFEAFLRGCFNAGIDTIKLLTDIGIPNGTYNLLDGPYTFDQPRWKGAVAVQQNPPAPAPLAISVSTDRQTRVNLSSPTRIIVTGGRGEITVTASPLVPGRELDGHIIGGTFTQQTTQPVIAAITASDEYGSTPVTYSLVQNVGPAPILHNVRYLRLVVYENARVDQRTFYVGLKSLTVQAKGSTVDQYATWAGDEQTSNPVAILNAPNTSGNDWSPQILSSYSDGARIVGDLGKALLLDTVSFIVRNPDNAPGRFKLYGSPNPLTKDGNDGFLILDQNIPDANGWHTDVPRTFDLDTTAGSVPFSADAAVQRNGQTYTFTLRREQTVGAQTVTMTLGSSFAYPPGATAADFGGTFPSKTATFADGSATTTVSFTVPATVQPE